MCDAPSVVLEPIRRVVRGEQVDEVGVGAVDDKVEAECLQEDLLRGEDLARNLVDFLKCEKKQKKTKGERIPPCTYREKGYMRNTRTGPLSGMSRTSIPFALDWHTLATSLSFLPHSSVFVARNMQAAAIV